MKLKKPLTLVMAGAMLLAPLRFDGRGPHPQTAEAGWKRTVVAGAIGVGIVEVEQIKLLTAVAAVTMGTPYYVKASETLADVVWHHPFVGPPALMAGIKESLGFGDLNDQTAAKLEADILALQKHPGGVADARPDGYGDRPLPDLAAKGFDAAPLQPANPGRSITDGAIGRIPGLQAHIDDLAKLTGLDPADIELGVYEKLSPETIANFIRGNKFNVKERKCFKYNEVSLGKLKYKFLDSYVPGREIVSRKHTQLAAIAPETAVGYIRELSTKYKPGTLIGDTPRNREFFGDPPGVLVGDMYLDVPMQDQPIPQYLLDMADRHDVTIRQRPEECPPP